MKVTIRGEKTKVTESMTEYAVEKMSKLDKYIDNSDAITATILMKIRDHQNKVEVTIPLKSFILRAEEVQNDFYSAIDVVIDKLERQIRKNKTRLQTQLLKVKKEFILDYDINTDEEDNVSEVIVKRKIVEVKPMDEEEAILQMELVGHQFYLFKDSETLKPMVVYKRKDGDYGLIEAE